MLSISAAGDERSHERALNIPRFAAQIAALETIMQRLVWSLLIAAPLASACGGSMPPPTQRLADAQSAERSAREVGAESVPATRLSLNLAHKQITQAQTVMADGDNRSADSLLVRAKADAELALAQVRAQNASVSGQKAVEDSAAQKATNAGQGAVK